VQYVTELKYKNGFVLYSKKGGTNWDNLPELMQGYHLSESGFVTFVETYLKQQKEKLHKYKKA
jgi:hypothetical protein